MTYTEHLKSDYFAQVKRKARLREMTGYASCAICGSSDKLELHHIAYKVGSVSIVGAELDHLDWLVYLCHRHHGQVHRNSKHPLNPDNKHKLTYSQYKAHKLNSPQS
jgi:hypothetical protein